MKTEFLYYDYIDKLKVVRNNHYSHSDNIYSKLHRNGFEFTHHDIISNEMKRKSFKRKISRLQALDHRKKVKIFYQYRNNEHLIIQSIIVKAEEFLSYYIKRNITCEFIFFTQKIIFDEKERNIKKFMI